MHPPTDSSRRLWWQFWKPKAPTLRYKVALTDDAKFHAVAVQLLDDDSVSVCTVLLAQRDAAVDRCVKLLDEAGLPWGTYRLSTAAPDDAPAVGRAGTVLLTNAEALPSLSATLSAPAPLRLIGVEAPTTSTAVETILAFVAQTGAAVEHYVSIEDPLLEALSGPGTEAMLRRLGMTDDGELLEHGMLNRSIAKSIKHVESSA